MATVLRVSWAYSLRKEELCGYLTEFGCESGGTVEEQRKRFAQFLAESHDPERLRRLLQLQSKHEPTAPETKPVTPKKGPQVTITSTDGDSTVVVTNTEGPPQHSNVAAGTSGDRESSMASGSRMDSNQVRENTSFPTQSGVMEVKTIADQIRKWGIGFDGEREPLEFVERLEELAYMYQIPTDRMPPLMPEVLSGKALVWYRNNNQHWGAWSDFRRDFLKFFLPLRYFEQLEDEIRKRRQKPRETFKNYTLSMQNLMRHSGYNEVQKLERIFRNASPEYQWYIRRRDFLTLGELLEMAEDMESIPPIPQHSREQHRQILPEENQSNTEPPINPRTACRRCGQDGHFAAQCSNEVMLFCWTCGRRNIRTIQCCRRRSGNENQDRIIRGGTDPQPNNPQL